MIPDLRKSTIKYTDSQKDLGYRDNKKRLPAGNMGRQSFQRELKEISSIYSVSYSRRGRPKQVLEWEHHVLFRQFPIVLL